MCIRDSLLLDRGACLIWRFLATFELPSSTWFELLLFSEDLRALIEAMWSGAEISHVLSALTVRKIRTSFYRDLVGDRVKGKWPSRASQLS